MFFTDVNSDNANVITRDVCIIGGGSSGTYSAIQLQKAGKSVVVVEKEKFMGGHTNTYADPATNQTIDYGVVVFENNQIVKDYFDYLGVPWLLAPLTLTDARIYFDFSTNTIVTAPSNPFDIQAYVDLLLKYPELTEGFFLPTPVPDDLLLPFGKIVTKYNITESAVNLVFLIGQGLGDILRQPSLYVFKIAGLNIMTTDLLEGFVVTKNNNNMDIYNKAYEMLKPNVLLQSYPIKVVRSPSGVKVTVKTPKGIKLIKAKKLLISIPPKLCNLKGFDLSAHERSLFSQFQNTAYYTGLVRNTGLPPNTTVENINTRNLYNLPTLPGLYALTHTTDDEIWDVKYGSPDELTDDYVKADVLNSLLVLQQMGIANKTVHAPEFIRFNSHTPFALTVSPEAIKALFYNKLNALQGERNTYYTGAALESQNSGLLWQFTNNSVLPLLINEL